MFSLFRVRKNVRKTTPDRIITYKKKNRTQSLISHIGYFTLQNSSLTNTLATPERINGIKMISQ
uniref:Uncharacterized protein n=1 Tax=Anguilla anguilla TaxID=7936 RepID=A0A0E9X486_ANGAN